MFLTLNQLYVFICSIGIGVFFGAIFSFISFFLRKNSNGILKNLIYIIIFVLFSIIYIIVSYKLNFPNFRLYMIFGIMLGGFLYYKSLYIILAKCVKLAYNKCIKINKGIALNDRRKNKKY